MTGEDGNGHVVYNTSLLSLARHYGFHPRACRPYRAKTKGKVERFNSYLKSSFVVPLAATLEAAGLKLDVGMANVHVRRWLDEVANTRLHATTKAVPALRLAKDTKIPVTFGCVTNPIETGVLASLDKPTGTNVTGFYTIPPVKPNFDIILAVKPDIKTIGTIWNSGETNSKALDALAKAEAEKRGIKWVTVTVTSSAEIKNAAESLVGKVDAFVRSDFKQRPTASWDAEWRRLCGGLFPTASD